MLLCHRIAKAILMLAAVPILAPAQPVKVFDVVAIRPHDPNEPTRDDTLPGGRVIFRNLTAKALFEFAWNVRHDQTSGEPDWFGQAYDIDAKADVAFELTPEQLRLPLRALFEDRFKLVAHSETRELTVYDLVIAPGGPKLRAASADETASAKWLSRNHIVAQKLPMNSIVKMLSANPDIQRSVTDRTGLTGGFDFTLQWTPLPPLLSSGDPAPLPEGPSIFEALTEQLGLKLITKKGPDQFVVIDHVELPSAN
jgi:uncharacterized protein (TIGR03435 family)